MVPEEVPDDHASRPVPSQRTRPARAHKAAMTVAMQIVEEISSQDHPAGTKLPAEKEMLEQYGVGRGTLRESLRFLEMNGVIIMKPGPGGGPIVGQPDARDLAGTLALFLQLQRTPFGSIVEVRQQIEPVIAGMAAKNAKPEALEHIRESVALMRDNLDDERLFLKANEQFHDLVAWASGNTVFALLLSSLHWITDGSPLGVDYPRDRRVAVLAAHERIYTAMADQDVESARSAMERHINEFERYLSRYYSSASSSLLRWSDIAL
jgi:DNA-binding FadR family transcriptional regulator